MELHHRAPQQGAVPPPLGETSDTRNPKDVLHTVNIAIMIVVLCLTTPLFALRMYVRSIILRTMGREECKSHLTLIFRWTRVSCRISGMEFAKRRDLNRELPRCIRMNFLQISTSCTDGQQDISVVLLGHLHI